MWKYRRLIPAILVLFISSVLHAEDIEVGDCGGDKVFSSSSSWFGDDETCVSKNHSSVVVKRPGGTYIATGAAAAPLAQAMAESMRIRVIPPTPPRQFELRDSSGFLMGGFSELLPGSGILITDRHVLQGQTREMVASSLQTNGADLNNYLFYEARQSGTTSPYDVILAVPKGKESEILEDASGGSACPCDGLRPMVLRALDAFRKQIGADDLYYSYQFGTVGKKETEQRSQGKVSRTTGIPVERFYLDAQEQDYTTARSSGSLVYLAPTPEQSGVVVNPEWRPGGIVECQIEARTSRSGVRIPGGAQVLPFSTLIDRAEFLQIPLEKVLREERKQDSDCKPIDGRGGGG